MKVMKMAQSMPRKDKHAAEFLQALRGTPLIAIKRVLRAEFPGSSFPEVTKAALAERYAKGKMSLGGSLESQRFRALDLGALQTRSVMSVVDHTITRFARHVTMLESSPNCGHY